MFKDSRACKANRISLAIVILSTITFGSVAHAAAALKAYNADPSKSTVSGLSAGGFMANQLGYAYSATFKGVGVFAGGPYQCAAHNNYTACMYNASISSSQLSTMQTDINNWSGNQIDNKSNVANQKIFMFVGSSDTTVGPNPMNAMQTQYTNNGATSSNLRYVNQSSPSTAHTFPTDFDSTGNNSCSSAASPYISNCSFDGAKAALSQFYGTLNARNNSPDYTNNLIAFDQSAFTSNAGMDTTGYVYVPSNCQSGAACKVHVALHGCLQSYSQISDKFLKNTGYTRWADTNSIIVLFPQTKVDNTSHSTNSGSLSNPNACWDWIGWYGSNFGQKAGPQMSAIKAMVDKITSGYTGSTTTTTAAGGTTTTTTTTTTQAHAYDQTATDTVTNHYVAGRINATQYNTLGARYGYNTVITLYHCPSLNGWTDHSNCSAI
ncbi:MAG TPA: PHB depolymerase family esterase [Burkholderiaceae bacterium]